MENLFYERNHGRKNEGGLLGMFVGGAAQGSSFITSHTAALWSQTANPHIVITGKGKCV